MFSLNFKWGTEVPPNPLLHKNFSMKSQAEFRLNLPGPGDTAINLTSLTKVVIFH
jgi:hypothetical protein